MESALPDSLTVNGESYAIDPSVENCIDIMQMYESPDLSEAEKHRHMMFLFYIDQPPYCEEALRAAIDFLNSGEEMDEAAGRSQKPSRRYYSFTQDLKYIRTAIQRTHGVNIREQWDLHWWKFMDMFMDLDEDSTFSRILHLRQARAKGKLTKEEKKQWREMREILELKNPSATQSAEERNAVEEQLKYLEGLSMTKGADENGNEQPENIDQD